MKDNSKYNTISLPTSTWRHCFVGIEAKCNQGQPELRNLLRNIGPEGVGSI